MAAPVATSRFAALWNSEVGPKTVHFWAPVMKWGLAVVTFSQFQLPPEQISAQSNFALMCTGILWTRWSLIIKPKNVLLASCNAFLGVSAATQLGRLYLYNKEQKKLGTADLPTKVDAVKV